MPFFTGAILGSSFVVSLLISVALTAARMLLFPPKRPEVPQQEAAPRAADGKFNQKQNVPSLTVVLGRVKKGGDYVFLEESFGNAYHGIVWAGHRIEGFVQFYMHDAAVTIDGSGWVQTLPDGSFAGEAANIETRLGLDAETAWEEAVAAFPTIWTTDHRGDGLAQLLMRVTTMNDEQFSKVFPNGMPLPTAVGDGAIVYDPRAGAIELPESWSFSRNLALLRLFHLTHPSGGKLTLDDMYLPDWAAAADVCDEIVENRDAVEEPRYHGGLWYYHSDDPVGIGRTLDEAGELVVYSRADGLIGVHAGVFTEPDIRITENDMLEFTYAANRSVANTVLAVRGRFTDPGNHYNTADAAIWGDPYTDDNTQRTRTIDNVAVQSHNHMQRLQKISFIRANAARVSMTIPYLADSPSRLVAQRRFVTIHYPARGLDEAAIEIIGRPRLSLANLTLSFEGIVVPDTLYDFDPVYEEGEPPPSPDQIAAGDVPVPIDFAIDLVQGVVSGGQTGVRARASWDFVSSGFTYELEYQFSDESNPPAIVTSVAGQSEVETPFLVAGREYQFRLRTVSNGKRSAWTSYITETVVADTTATGQPTDFAITPDTSTAVLSWVNPASPNLYKTVLYRSTVNTFGSAVSVYETFGNPGIPQSFEDGPFISGAYYWWAQSFNASNVGSGEVGSLTTTF